MTKCESPIFWHNCYNQSYDLWCSDAYQHPAKMSVALAFKIMAHLKELGLLAEGESILDPMCGIATTGLVAGALGHPFIGVELEDKFVQLSLANKEYTERKLYKKLDWQLIQGDSRRLSEFLHDNGLKSVVSPPYSEVMNTEKCGIDWSKDKSGRDKSKEPAYQPESNMPSSLLRYSANPDNIGNLKDTPLKAIVSPPYTEARPSSSVEPQEAWKPEFKGRGKTYHSKTKGQIGQLPHKP